MSIFQGPKSSLTFPNVKICSSSFSLETKIHKFFSRIKLPITAFIDITLVTNVLLFLSRFAISAADELCFENLSKAANVAFFISLGLGEDGSSLITFSGGFSCAMSIKSDSQNKFLSDVIPWTDLDDNFNSCDNANKNSAHVTVVCNFLTGPSFVLVSL